MSCNGTAISTSLSRMSSEREIFTCGAALTGPCGRSRDLNCLHAILKCPCPTPKVQSGPDRPDLVMKSHCLRFGFGNCSCRQSCCAISDQRNEGNESLGASHPRCPLARISHARSALSFAQVDDKRKKHNGFPARYIVHSAGDIGCKASACQFEIRRVPLFPKSSNSPDYAGLSKLWPTRCGTGSDIHCTLLPPFFPCIPSSPAPAVTTARNGR